MLLDLAIEIDKPIALFTNQNMKDVPDWNPDMFSSWQPKGAGGMYTLFKTPTSSMLKNFDDENCSELVTWTSDNLRVKLPNTAIWFGQDKWCRKVKSRVMEIVVAELGETKIINTMGKEQVILTVLAAIWEGGEIGPVSDNMRRGFS